jgi:hypothetical protein
LMLSWTINPLSLRAVPKRILVMLRGTAHFS